MEKVHVKSAKWSEFCLIFSEINIDFFLSILKLKAIELLWPFMSSQHQFDSFHISDDDYSRW